METIPTVTAYKQLLIMSSYQTGIDEEGEGSVFLTHLSRFITTQKHFG